MEHSGGNEKNPCLFHSLQEKVSKTLTQSSAFVSGNLSTAVTSLIGSAATAPGDAAAADEMDEYLPTVAGAPASAMPQLASPGGDVRPEGEMEIVRPSTADPVMPDPQDLENDDGGDAQGGDHVEDDDDDDDEFLPTDRKLPSLADDDDDKEQDSEGARAKS